MTRMERYAFQDLLSPHTIDVLPTTQMGKVDYGRLKEETI